MSAATEGPNHYRVCFQVATKDYLAQRLEDVVYVPRTLRELAARALPDDVVVPLLELQPLVEKMRGKAPYRAKTRCAGLQLKVGAFGAFPGALERPLPAMFTVDLQRGARAVLKFLSQAALPKDLANSCTVRYPAFLKLQAAHPTERLIAPPDVALVWFVHMLQSKEYQTFAASSSCFGLPSLPHCCTVDATTPGLLRRSQELWAAQGAGPFEVALAAALPPGRGRLSFPTHSAVGPACGLQPQDYRVQGSATREAFSLPDEQNEMPLAQMEPVVGVPTVECLADLPRLPAVVRSDLSWFKQFCQANGANPTDEHLLHWQLGYQRFLYLLTKYPFAMERVGFAPTPGIDLFFHTHLLHPGAYFRDVGFLMMRGASHHKLLPMESQTPFVYEAHKGEEARMWDAEFPDDPLASYVAK